MRLVGKYYRGFFERFSSPGADRCGYYLEWGPERNELLRVAEYSWDPMSQPVLWLGEIETEKKGGGDVGGHQR